MHRTREKLGWPAAVVRTIRRNRRRYGGYVVHLGVLLIVIGFAGAAFKTERQALLTQGDEMRVGNYVLVYEDHATDRTAEKQITTAKISVFDEDSELVTTMYPQRNFHFAQQQPQSEVAIRTTPIEDLYVVVTAFDRDGTAAVRAFVNPLTWWIWAGAVVMALGMIVILSESPVTSRSRAPVTRTEPAVAAR